MNKSCFSCKHFLGTYTTHIGFDCYICDIPKSQMPKKYTNDRGECVKYEYNGVGPITNKYYRPEKKAENET